MTTTKESFGDGVAGSATDAEELLTFASGARRGSEGGVVLSTTGGTGTSEDGGGGGGGEVIRLNTSKAGMEGLDVEKINKVINETSKGSKFYEHQKRKQEQLQQKVEELKAHLASLSPETVLKAQKQADAMAVKMEEKRDLSRAIVHIDMDCFYAACEMRDTPTLRDVPMAVGGNSMLCTSNYHARRFGVRAGMPGFIAKKLCPQLIMIPVNFDKYIAASKQVERVLKEYDSNLSISMDEAVMDITECLELRNNSLPEAKQITASELVNEMRRKIFEATQLTASAGIAANGFLAKICSDVNKPDNQFYLEPSVEAINAFLHELPIRKVVGIGPVTENLLKGINIHTVADLWNNRGIVNLSFKPATASFLLAVSKGIGSSFFTFPSPDSESDSDVRKSMSCERTFGKASREELKDMCRELSKELEKDLGNKGATGKTITLKIKTIQFQVKTRCRTIAEYTTSASVIFETAWAIYCSYENELPDLQLRLMGIRMSNLRFNNNPGEEGQAIEESSSLKQQTLSQLFKKTAKAKSSDGDAPTCKYNCPSCGQDFERFRDLEGHVDDCLLDSETDSKLQPLKISALPSSAHVEEVGPSKADNPNKQPQNAGEIRRFKNHVVVTCPVCSRSFKYKSEDEIEVRLNKHIDVCLNVTVVKEMFQEEGMKKQTEPPTNSSPTTTADANGASSSAQPTTPVSATPGSASSSSSSKRPLEEEKDVVGSTSHSSTIASTSTPTPPSAKRLMMASKPKVTIVTKSGKGKDKKSGKKKSQFKCFSIDNYFKRDDPPQ